MTTTDIRFRPFSNGSQFADWESCNCDRCTKSKLGDDGYAINCPLLNALFEAQMDDGTISEADAKGIGYLDENDQTTRRYVWPCNQVVWTEEWKAAYLKAQAEA